MAAPITTATPSPRTTTPKPPSSPSPHHHPAATPPRCHAIPIIIIIIPSPSSCHHHRDIIPPPPPGGMSGIVLTPQGVLFRWTTATMGVVGVARNRKPGDSRERVFVSLGLHSNKGAYGFVISTKEGALGLKPPQHHLGCVWFGL
ncbi:hypothetical protein Tco_1316471 [Tanacetum coccineum]